ncbi:MAG: PA4642 family protein [Gammaproteobacteria bacterium]|nr:PA4642 family protein [Gammaproteobacteria bacterium]
MRPDKAKVVDEIWDEERIRGFLDKTPMGDEKSADYSVLLYGYRSMRANDFAVFIGMYLDAGRDLNATSNAGLSLLETIRDHRQSAAFRKILENPRQATPDDA